MPGYAQGMQCGEQKVSIAYPEAYGGVAEPTAMDMEGTPPDLRSGRPNPPGQARSPEGAAATHLEGGPTCHRDGGHPQRLEFSADLCIILPKPRKERGKGPWPSCLALRRKLWLNQGMKTLRSGTLSSSQCQMAGSLTRSLLQSPSRACSSTTTGTATIEACGLSRIGPPVRSILQAAAPSRARFG